MCWNLLHYFRLAVVREEKDALAEALERLRSVGTGSTSETRGLREAVHSLEEQLLKERAKSQRSASKRGQEQRQLMEQVNPCNLGSTLASDRHCYSTWVCLEVQVCSVKDEIFKPHTRHIQIYWCMKYYILKHCKDNKLKQYTINSLYGQKCK